MGYARLSTELDMGLRPTHWDENWIESVGVRSMERGRQRSFALWIKRGRDGV
jgi:hypothetical protein